MQLHEKFKELENEMCDYLFERDDPIHGLMLSLLSRNHIFLVGTAGTAKSMMIRMLNEAVTDADYWEKLFTRFTTPDEVFGPVKFSALKNDKFERNINNHLPEAHFAFIDEIWKANSSILNSLLTIINERIYHNNGSPINVPLETLMTASNELPEEREELDAMWDRFLLKYRVRCISEDDSFGDMLKKEIDSIDTTFTLDEIHEAQKMVNDIILSDEVIEQIIEIRRQLEEEGIEPSDRRYKWSMDVIRAEAWLNGRDKANPEDLQILSHILWDEIEHISKVDEVIKQIVNPYLREAEELYDSVMDEWREVQRADEGEKISVASEASAKMKEAINDFEKLKEKLEDEGKRSDKIDGYIKKVQSIRINNILKDIMDVNLEDL